MRYWKCPSCKRIREYKKEENLVMKVCRVCQEEMKVVYNGRRK